MLAELNPAQREVVELRRHCVAVACPGAGKTKTIATKAAMLLADPKATVGAVTFSKDAALELRERILALAGPATKKRLLAGTFHSLAYKQLGRRGGGAPDIATEGDRTGLLIQVLSDVGMDWKVEDAIAAIEAIKTNFGQVQSGSAEELLYRGYQDSLERNGKIDFQDMLRLAVEGMQNGTIEPYPFTYLLVDEFQDTDPLQYQWIALHARAGSIVTVVGDDDQSIYGFRSALGFRGMESFIRQFDAQPVVLGNNYRCHAEILGAADRIIRNNRDRIPKELVAHKGPGGQVRFQRFPDEYAEAVAAMEHLAVALRNGQSAAILARTNRILDPVEAVCRSHGVKYYRASGKSILSRPEAALMCNLLELVQKTKSTGVDALLPFVGIGTQELRLLHSKGRANTEQRQRKELLELGLSEASSDRYRELMKRLVEWRSLCDRQFYSLVLEGAREWMMQHTAADPARRAITTAYDVLSRLNGPFSERLEFLRRDNNEPAPDALILTTMHSSKGLEWDRVWIIRAEETVVPDEKSTESEERRLFYVAVTRAREDLRLSMAKKNPTSRFVLEAGIDVAIAT
ncbi:ATP-dependent helicase (plasmid) [Cupriavidus sp. KK10]|jgi:superfamily I DNA/RNA helicase|uniref:ATP-dependent helicase n=1 Tax=Cupriavidus sp. KK10 TaxID=1478019 RepID=UPI001BA8B28E|nr:ATP-dependent helicase [Cupriavidus sp. KK10]QUN31781.1 ATP-dependent helicase [Cupriavidus sp. KK10]